jgi:cytochrome P450 family 142 subfamily A polypeptide 1
MDLDLLDGALYAGDPEPAYAWLRRDAPVYRDQTNELWGVSRHADVSEIEKDPESFCSRRGYRPKLTMDDLSMIGQDDPGHLAQRKVLHQRFMPRQVARLEPQLRATAAGLIGALAREGRCDLVRALAVPLPVITIIELLGFPRERWPELAHWSEVTNAAGGGPRYRTPELMPAIEAFFAATSELIAARRADPRDDLISRMLADPARSDASIRMEALLLLNGGSDTTRHVIGGATLALLQDRPQWDWLRANPRALPVAVEEFIRWVTPILNMRRTAARDLELHGHKLREGDELLLMYGAANRDERVFREPQSFDVRRRPNPHLAFGFGTHFCLGASLARLELRVVFEELLARLPDLRLAPGFEPEWIPNAFTRGLRSLDVEFAPRRTGETHE